MNRQTPAGMRVGAVLAGLVLTGSLHEVIPLSSLHSHNALQHLFYLPIVLAGLSFGWPGGLAAALLAGLADLPFNLRVWNLYPSFALDQILEVPLFCAAGVFTGLLARRERKQRADLERVTEQLGQVYQELQDNFEQMKRAERLSALGQLAAGMAHEVRNPLASIAGAAGILQRNLRLQNSQAECLTIIVKECQRLNDLLTHFLAFARPRSPQYQTVEIASLFRAVLDLAGHAATGKTIRFHTEVGAVGPLDCDPELLQQVILNLVINSIQALPQGGEVELLAKPEDSRIVIQVRDNGCGVREPDRDRIFDPFFTTKETGTGLGLPVAHKIVEQHGGFMTAQNNPGGGMTFSVVLPIHAARQHDA